jgi:hypothetical protein
VVRHGRPLTVQGGGRLGGVLLASGQPPCCTSPLNSERRKRAGLTQSLLPGEVAMAFLVCGKWCTQWRATEDIRQHSPPKGTDYRDRCGVEASELALAGHEGLPVHVHEGPAV